MTWTVDSWKGFGGRLRSTTASRGTTLLEGTAAFRGLACLKGTAALGCQYLVLGLCLLGLWERLLGHSGAFNGGYIQV